MLMGIHPTTINRNIPVDIIIHQYDHIMNQYYMIGIFIFDYRDIIVESNWNIPG
jgi:hypothetical protein